MERGFDSRAQSKSERQVSIKVVRISRVFALGLYFIADGGSFSFSWMNLVDFVVVIRHMFWIISKNFLDLEYLKNYFMNYSNSI